MNESVQPMPHRPGLNRGRLFLYAIFFVIWVAADQVMKTPLTRADLLVNDLKKSAIVLVVWGLYAVAKRGKRRVRPIP
jgi:hypothetical protein